MQKLLIARLRLSDFLTFSSTISFTSIGDVSYPIYKPQPYLHNYALMYGFAGLLYASLASPKGQLNEIDYGQLDEIEEKFYVYPARPKAIGVRRLLCHVKSEGFAEPVQPKPKTVYPWHVVHMAFTPGSEFETVIVVRDERIKLPKTIRVGVKRQGVFSVEYQPAEVKGYVSGLSDPINLGDALLNGLAPNSYVVLLSTRTSRRNVHHSNLIVKGYYYEDKLALIEATKGGRTTFKLPLMK
jgi:CRISPR type I-D-associated protein Csc1